MRPTQNRVTTNKSTPGFRLFSLTQPLKKCMLSRSLIYDRHNCNDVTINYTSFVLFVIIVCSYISTSTTSANSELKSSRSVLIKQAKDGQFKCGQVPVYKRSYATNIEPGLRAKALANSINLIKINNTNTNSNLTTTISASLTPPLGPNDSNGNFRILYGLDAKSGEWPWIVKIDVCQPNGDCEMCTGSLLNDRWLVTAGHCKVEQLVWQELYEFMN